VGAAQEAVVNELLRKLLFLPEQASTVAREIDYLHYFVIITTMLGAAAVAGFTLYFIIKYREGTHRGGDLPPDERPHHSRGGLPVWLEISVFGGLLGLFLLWWVLGFAQYGKISETPPNAMPVYVTGKQWMWSFAYPNGGGSNGVLYVPAGRPVKLIMTSRDVIHSFFVPQFRLKRDVLPGRTTTMWFEAPEPGRYPLYCTEYCGTGHSTMLGEVVVLAEADYRRQLDGLAPLQIAGTIGERLRAPGELAPPDLLSLASVGERVAVDQGCMRCHTSDGTPHIGPTWAGLYGATIQLADGGTVIAEEAYLTSSMMDPAAQVHRGFPPVMPSYQGRLSAAETGALVEYIRALRDVPRHEAGAPLPAQVPGNVPIVTPLPGARP
jgi:cytochrome c oxidase subunit 2